MSIIGPKINTPPTRYDDYKQKEKTAPVKTPDVITAYEEPLLPGIVEKLYWRANKIHCQLNNLGGIDASDMNTVKSTIKNIYNKIDPDRDPENSCPDYSSTSSSASEIKSDISYLISGLRELKINFQSENTEYSDCCDSIDSIIDKLESVRDSL